MTTYNISSIEGLGTYEHNDHFQVKTVKTEKIPEILNYWQTVIWKFQAVKYDSFQKRISISIPQLSEQVYEVNKIALTHTYKVSREMNSKKLAFDLLINLKIPGHENKLIKSSVNYLVNQEGWVKEAEGFEILNTPAAIENIYENNGLLVTIKTETKISEILHYWQTQIWGTDAIHLESNQNGISISTPKFSQQKYNVSDITLTHVYKEYEVMNVKQMILNLQLNLKTQDNENKIIASSAKFLEKAGKWIKKTETFDPNVIDGEGNDEMDI